MDTIFLISVLIFFLAGVLKGGGKTVLSFVSLAVGLLVAFLFYQSLSQLLWGFCGLGESVKGLLKNILDGKINGRFNSQNEVLSLLNGKSLPYVFIKFFQGLLSGISFEGGLSFGDVFASTLSWKIVKGISFVIIYVLAKLICRSVLTFVLKNIGKKPVLNFGNRVLGGALGIFKGVVYFGVVYFLFLQVATITLNEALLNFLQSSEIAPLVYEKLFFR